MSIRGSKVFNFSLVSSKSLIEILASCGWGPGPNNSGQNGVNLLHLWYHPEKI